MERGAVRRIAGVELGGTKCIAVLGDERGIILEQRVFATTRPQDTLPLVHAQLASWWDDGGFAGLGIGSFGPIDLDPASAGYGSITTTPKIAWRGAAIVDPLADGFDVPVAFDTDVNGAAMAEGSWGAAHGLRDYAYVTVGTGVGVGLIVNGAPTRGLLHCEAGHMRVARLPGDAWPGTCPYHGDCVEGLAAGPAIAARAGAPGETLAGDDPVWDGVVEALAQMIQALVVATGPRRFLVGGGVLGQRPGLHARIDARVHDLLAGYLPLPAEPLVTGPALGANAGPLGPIALALAQLS